MSGFDGFFENKSDAPNARWWRTVFDFEGFFVAQNKSDNELQQQKIQELEDRIRTLEQQNVDLKAQNKNLLGDIW